MVATRLYSSSVGLCKPRGVRGLFWLALLVATTNAGLFLPGTVHNDSAISFYNYGPQDFLNCASYSKTRSSPVSASISAPILRNASTGTALPFEDYWCSSYGKQPQSSQLLSFQNNGSVNPEFYGINPSAKTICQSVEKADYSSWAAASHVSTTLSGIAFNSIKPAFWTPTLTPPCCNTYCDLNIASAQLNYWPTPAPHKNITTVVGPNNFTYTSPSVYVVYKGIFATNDCGQTLGSATSDLTVSFNPSDLTTFRNNPEGGYGYVPINYATLLSNCTSRYTYSSGVDPGCKAKMTASDGSCNAQMGKAAADQLNLRNHCYPQLPFPSTALLQGLNPAWSVCDLGNVDTSIVGVFDPPRAMAPGVGLAPPVPTQVPGHPAVIAAAPASQVAPPLPSKTAVPGIPAPVSDPTNNPPAGGSSDPGNSKDPAKANPQADPGPASNGPAAPNGAQPAPSQPAPVVGPANGLVNAPANQPANEPPHKGSGPGAPASTPESNPVDPNAESAAQISALHQALGPAQPAQNSGASQPPVMAPANDPANNQEKQPTSGPANGGSKAGGPVQKSGPSPSSPVADQGSGSKNAPVNAPAKGLANDSNNGGSSSGGPTQNPGSSQPDSVNNPANSPVNAPATGAAKNPANKPSSEGSGPGENAPNSGSNPTNPTPAAKPLPQFAIPAANGEILSGAIINPNSIIVAGQSDGATVAAGAPAVQILGHTISVDPAASSIVIDGQSHALPVPNPHVNNNPAAATPPPFTTTIHGHNVQAVPSSPSAILVDGQYISLGGATTISNTPVVFHSNGDLAIGSSTINNIANNILPIPPPSSAPPLFITTNNGHSVQAVPSSSSAILVDGQHISLGGATIISNTPAALHSNGDLILGTSTVNNIINNILPSSPPPRPPVVFTAAGRPATLLPNGIAVAGTTLTRNAPAITVSGTCISHGTDGLVIGTSTVALPSQAPETVATITLAGQAFTYSASPVAIAGSNVVGGSSSIPTTNNGPSATQDVGGFILSGLNGVPASTGSAGPDSPQTNATSTADGTKTSLGAASKVTVRSDYLIVMAVLVWLQREIVWA